MTSISPDLTTKNGTLVWPPSINTSPRVIVRITPRDAIRAICAGLNVGNMSAAWGALVSSVERAISCDMVTRPGQQVRPERRHVRRRRLRLHGRS